MDNIIKTLIKTKAVKATKYISPKEIIRVTRTRYNGTFSRGNIELTVTIGKPNFVEREFIRSCIKAGEKFPVKKVQLKFFKK